MGQHPTGKQRVGGGLRHHGISDTRLYAQPHQAQLVAQLLVLLDGLDARGQVVVLAVLSTSALIWQSDGMPSYRGYRFPPDIISHASVT